MANLEVAGERSERRVGEQVNAAFETLVGEALLDRGDQTAASRASVGFSQDCMLRRDRTI